MLTAILRKSALLKLYPCLVGLVVGLSAIHGTYFESVSSGNLTLGVPTSVATSVAAVEVHQKNWMGLEDTEAAEKTSVNPLP